MTPIAITSDVSTLSTQKLQEKLKFLSVTFLVNADFTREDAVKELVENLETYVLESLLRIFEKQYGSAPYQNKIYEKIEDYFGDPKSDDPTQDEYNLCRMMSSLRRAKLVPIDPTNAKYLNWMGNRIKYGIKTLVVELDKVGDYVPAENDNVRTPATV